MSEARRPWLAALLALLYPGLGHVYLRAWLRALAWFVVAMVTAVLVVPPSVLETAGQGGLDGFLAAQRSLPLEATAAILAIGVFSAVDAYVLARETAATDEPTCPECGEVLDEELDFCPWCTARLDEEPAEAEPTR